MRRGLLLALASGIALGGITSFASLAYGHGAMVAELMVARGLFATLVVAAYCRLLGQPLVPGRAGRGFGILIGLSLTLVGFGYMGAVVFITPGLAVALLFVYPVLVLAGESALRRQWPDMPSALAFGLALAGIVASVGVGVGLGGLDWRGVALGLAAAVGMAAMLLLAAASKRRGHGMSVLVPAQGITLLAGLGFLAWSGSGGSGDAAGAELAGYGFMGLAALLYGVGLLLSFIAVRIAPAPKVALMMNVEPITTLLAARALVGEELSLAQYAGILMAVAGIAVGGMLGRGRQAATRTGAARYGTGNSSGDRRAGDGGRDRD